MSSNGEPLTREHLLEKIRTCGSDHEETFGYPLLDDGLYLQQAPEEYADFVQYMLSNVPPARLSLEIGIASGGQTKFLRDYYQVDQTIVVDIGEHHNFDHWARIKKSVKSDIVLEVIGDSHTDATRKKLLPYARTIDFAFVDGDHSYHGLKQDMFLIKDLLKPGAVVALHDTMAVPDCHRVYQEMLKSVDFELLKNFDNRFGISVWRFTAEAPFRESSWLNRRFGFGQI